MNLLSNNSMAQDKDNSKQKLTDDDIVELVRISVKRKMAAVHEDLEAELKKGLQKSAMSVASTRVEIQELRQEVANLRVELSQQREQIKQYSDFIAKSALQLKSKLDSLKQTQRREEITSNFLSGDSGFLNSLADMISAARSCYDPDSSGWNKRLERFIGLYLWPLANKLVIYDKAVTTPQPIQEENLDGASAMANYEMWEQECQRLEGKPLFYTQLFDALEPTLRRISNEQYENQLSEGLPTETIAEMQCLMSEISSLVQDHGVRIIEQPSGEWAKFFLLPMGEQAERPLIVRASDQLVYAPGISSKTDPNISIY